MVGQFVIDLFIREPANIFPNTHLDVIILNDKGEVVWEHTTLIRKQFYIQVRSQNLPVIQRGRYVASLAIIDPMTEEAALHRQTIWVEHPFSPQTPTNTFFI